MYVKPMPRIADGVLERVAGIKENEQQGENEKPEDYPGNGQERDGDILEYRDDCLHETSVEKVIDQRADEIEKVANAAKKSTRVAAEGLVWLGARWLLLPSRSNQR
jgi:hypothetical protein